MACIGQGRDLNLVETSIIYTHVPKIKGLRHIVFEQNLCRGSSGVTSLNPKYPRLCLGIQLHTNACYLLKFKNIIAYLSSQKMFSDDCFQFSTQILLTFEISLAQLFFFNISEICVKKRVLCLVQCFSEKQISKNK